MKFSGNTTRARRVEHPDGGVFYLRPIVPAEYQRLMDAANTTDYRRDKSTGQPLYNQKTGSPEYVQQQNIEDIIAFAIEHLDRFENVFNEETGEPFPSTDENKARMVREYIAEDGEALFSWIFANVMNVTKALKAVEEKNS